MFLFIGEDIFNKLANTDCYKFDENSIKCFSYFSVPPSKSLINNLYLGWSFMLFKTGKRLFQSGFNKASNSHSRELLPVLEDEIENISCGSKTCLLVTRKGQLYSFKSENLSPELVNLSKAHCRVKDATTEDLLSIILMEDGSVLSLNIHESVQLESILLSQPIKQVACGKEHVLLLSITGQVFSYGSGSRGQLGHGSIENQETPLLIEALDGIEIIRIAAGGWHSAAISYAGDLYMWGWNESGQLGLPCNELRGDTLPMEEIETVCCHPKIVDLGEESVKWVGCGSRHTASVTEENHLWTWGWNGYGQLGLPNVALSDRPEQVDLKPIFQIKDLKCKFWTTVLVGSIEDRIYDQHSS